MSLCLVYSCVNHSCSSCVIFGNTYVNIIHHFAVIHCFQKYNSQSFLPDIADHSKAASKFKHYAVNLRNLDQTKNVCRDLL